MEPLEAAKKPHFRLYVFAMLSALAKSAAVRQVAARSLGSTRGFAKEIKFGVEGRAAMLKGVETLADAVQVSPRGSDTLDSVVYILVHTRQWVHGIFRRETCSSIRPRP